MTMWLRQRISLLVRRPVTLVLLLALLGTAMTAAASPGSVTWTTKADFDNNESTVKRPTDRFSIETTTSPDCVKIGVPTDFVTTATITVVTPTKIYTTGSDRKSIAIIDSTTKEVTGSIGLEAPAAGVVYNSAENKLYVGQKGTNRVVVINVANDLVISTLTIGSSTSAAYAVAYHGGKVYLANTGDQTVTILDGATDTPVTAPLRVTAGATTATFDADVLYLTSKSNNYVTVISGDVVKEVEVDPIVGSIGKPGDYVGLRVNAPALGINGASKIYLTWKAASLGNGQNIQFQVRGADTETDIKDATYNGPLGSTTWYDNSSPGVQSTTEDDVVTTTVPLNPSYNGFKSVMELQLKLSWDGITSPLLHDVTLTYAFTINATAGEGGSIYESGDVPVPYGDSKTFVITAALGHRILDVIIDGTTHLGPVGTYTFTNVTADHTIEAIFERIPHSITAGCPLVGGSISPALPVTVLHGDSQTFEFTAESGNYIADVLVDGVSVGRNPTLTLSNITSDHTICVIFRPNPTITLGCPLSGGTITPLPPITVQYGSNQRFDISADRGYRIVDVIVDGTTHLGPVDTYTFTNVTDNHTICATFALVTHTITATAGPNGTITPSGTVTVSHGGDISFTPKPDPTYVIDTLIVDGQAVPIQIPYTFTNVTSDHTISVTFRPGQLKMQWSKEGSFGGWGGAFDSAGNFYFTRSVVVVSPWAAAYRMDRAGNITWSTEKAPPGGTIAATPSGLEVYCNSYNGIVYKYLPPAPDYDGRVYDTNRVLSSGLWTTTMGKSGEYVFAGAEVSVSGSRYNHVLKVNSNKTIAWTGVIPRTFSVSTPVAGIVEDSQGYIYVSLHNIDYADGANDVIYKFNPNGGSAPIATFARANTGSLAIDKDDNIYVGGGNTITKMRPDGTKTGEVYVGTLDEAHKADTIATDGVFVYVSYDKTMWAFDTNLQQKLKIPDVPRPISMEGFSYVFADGQGSVYVRSPWDNYANAAITKYTLQ